MLTKAQGDEMDRVPQDLKDFQPTGFVIFTREECAWILAALLFALVAVDLARAAFNWMFA